MTRKEPKVGEVWSFNYERYLHFGIEHLGEYVFCKYKGYRTLDVEITEIRPFFITEIRPFFIVARDIYGNFFYLNKNEFLSLFDYDHKRNKEWKALMNIKEIIE